MYPAAFAYVRAESLEHTLRLLVDAGDADVKLLAGGQSLLPLMKLRLAAPDLLVDIGGLAELSYLRAGGGVTRLGALTTYRTLQRSAELAAGFPALEDALRVLADPQVRARGTIGGSLAHADPAAELPAVATALDAKLRVIGPEGERTASPDEFFQSYMTTSLKPEELLAEVWFPPTPPSTGTAWIEVARRHGDYALVGVAAVLTLREDSACEEARLVYTGVTPVPFDAREASGLLVGEQPNEEAFAAAAESAATLGEPGSDVHATAGYRRHLVRVLTRRALGKALERAKESTNGA